MDAPRVDLAALREDYARGGLDVTDLTGDPFSMFTRWLTEAVRARLHEPNAMVVSTVSAEGRPSSRMVLLKSYDENGFVFFTNLSSRKGAELLANPACALLFGWHPLERQVRVEGDAAPLARAEVEAYFVSRPRGAQLGAWASAQSQTVADRDALAQSYAEVERRFAGAEVEVPPHWGGFRVAPDSVEFWQGRPGRMHDRLRYDRSDRGAWRVVRLAP